MEFYQDEAYLLLFFHLVHGQGYSELRNSRDQAFCSSEIIQFASFGWAYPRWIWGLSTAHYCALQFTYCRWKAWCLFGHIWRLWAYELVRWQVLSENFAAMQVESNSTIAVKMINEGPHPDARFGSNRMHFKTHSPGRKQCCRWNGEDRSQSTRPDGVICYSPDEVKDLLAGDFAGVSNAGSSLFSSVPHCDVDWGRE